METYTPVYFKKQDVSTVTRCCDISL